jgi:hypothetical protein
VGVASVGAGFGHGCCQRVSTATDQNDLPAFFEQGQCAGFANAGTGTGDEGDFGHGENFLERAGKARFSGVLKRNLYLE